MSLSDKPACDGKTASRQRIEQDILTAARRLFAQHGYEGVSIDRIAQDAGLSKQGLLYYFPKKTVLYRAVLDGVLDEWLLYMDALGQHHDDPKRAFSDYIAGKLRFSRDHPDGSRFFANEIIACAPHFSDAIETRVLPALQADEATYQRWVALGLCRPMDTRHLMIVLWAATQAYADFAHQICLVLRKSELDAQDFTDAGALITDMVLRTVLVSPEG